ncbi:MAG: hypothetical protein V4568_11395 [Pseudomonadota bacterium]
MTAASQSFSTESFAARGHVAPVPASSAGIYFPLWALVLPITSILILPGLQGTTPGNMFAILLLAPGMAAVTIGFAGAQNFYRDLMKFAMIYVSLNAIAQLGLATLDFPGFGTAQLVDPYDRSVLLRGTMFSQSLYLLTAVVTFTFVRHAYRPAWDKWLLAGAALLACYGLYEVVWFAATGINGDFLSNRRFGEGGYSGSQFQPMALGPLVTLRLKGLTGEPSMYAFTILPFWIYALHTGRKFIHPLLLGTLLLSLSTTAFIGIGLYCLLRVWFLRGRDKFTITLLVVGLLGALVAATLGYQGNPVILKTFNALFSEKLTAQHGSGEDRFQSFLSALHLFLSLPWLNKLFGVGFGYIRSPDFFSTLLVNMGIIGMLIFLFLFLLPVFKLGNSYRELGIKAALLVVTAAALTSVPEYSYLSTWLFLGIAYHALRQMREQDASSSSRREMAQPAAIERVG